MEKIVSILALDYGPVIDSTKTLFVMDYMVKYEIQSVKSNYKNMFSVIID